MKKLLYLIFCFLVFSSVSYAAMSTGTNLRNYFGTPYAQTITVAQSGGDYTTITAALASITDASVSKPYCIQVFPGIYNEAITMKEYIDLVGVDRDSCIIDFGNASAGTILTTVTSNCAISNLTYKTTNATNYHYLFGPTTAVNNLTITNVKFNPTGNYAHSFASFGVASMDNIIVKDCIANNLTNSIGTFYYDETNSGTYTNIYLINNKVSNMARFTDLQGKTGSTHYLYNNISNVSTQNNYILATGNCTVESKNNQFKTTGNQIGAAAGSLITWNSYNDMIVSITKAGAGGTETFNSYGSIVGGVLAHGDAWAAGASATASGDFTLTGKFEPQGAQYPRSATFAKSIGSNTFSYYLQPIAGQQLSLLLSPVANASNNSLVLSDLTNGYNKNYDHTSQTNPTLFIHSAIDPDTDNTQWIGIAHDGTRGVISTGTREVQFTSPILPKTVATTPDAYALAWATQGSFVYVTSARRLYIKGFSTWEGITSAP